MTQASDNRILIVDDEPDATATIKKGLEAHGFPVDAYNDPLKALAEYTPNRYRFHVIDIRMPGMNGFDFARQIWLLSPDAQVCFLSAFEIYEDEARKVFRDLNTTCFIKKPITPTALARHLVAHATAVQ